uniref:G_PROTEIN_RECEP_F1_2 domain-containing protein n=1 Tax=Steinernema glaseri TaxID=37863 RepID=A0A1I7YIF7_9BILA
MVIRVGLLLALLLNISILYLGAPLVRDARLWKPSDPNAYLDKADLLHVSHTWNFHSSLSSWMDCRSKSSDRCSTWRSSASERLEELVEEAQVLQKKLSKSEDDEYRNDVALRQVHFALAEKKNRDEVIEAIERYIKSINVDRVLVMEKFLAEYLASPQENAGDRLNGSLVPFDLKIAQLMKIVPAEYHHFTTHYWWSLKRSTIPGLKAACLPQNDDISSLVEKYNTVFDQRAFGCVPDVANSFPFKDIPARLVIILLSLCVLGGLIWIMHSLSKYCLSMYLLSKASETQNLHFRATCILLIFVLTFIDIFMIIVNVGGILTLSSY